jgi:hypothetical protein
MIALSDAQLSFVIAITTPLLPNDRIAFLRELAQRLEREPAIGDGVINRIARQILSERHYFRAPSAPLRAPYAHKPHKPRVKVEA